MGNYWAYLILGWDDSGKMHVPDFRDDGTIMEILTCLNPEITEIAECLIPGTRRCTTANYYQVTNDAWAQHGYTVCDTEATIYWVLKPILPLTTNPQMAR